MGGKRNDINHVPGTDAECYVSRLFCLKQNSNGTRRPDLVSADGIYNPPLVIEVKSSSNFKALVCLNQLHYPLTASQDYRGKLSERENQESLWGDKWKAYLPLILRGGGIAYYYDLVTRKDDVSRKDLKKPYSAIKFVWRDQFIFPHILAFSAFVSERARKTDVALGSCEGEVLEKVQKNILDENSAHDHTGQDFQNIYFRDLKAIYEGDDGFTTELGRCRLAYMRSIYPGVDDLKKFQFQGPNGTTIYALVRKEDYNLFNTQVREAVNERTPILDSVFRKRRNAIGLLDKILPSSTNYANGDVPREESALKSLGSRDIRRLEYLVKWINPENREDRELALDEVPF